MLISHPLPPWDTNTIYIIILPSISYDSEPSLPCPSEDRARISATTRANKPSRPTRLHLQRRSRNHIRSTSNAIYGSWDIQVKGGLRLQSKTKTRGGARGGMPTGTVS